MTAARRVVITGLGPITPIGIGVEGLWEGLRHEQSAVQLLTHFDASLYRTRIAGQVNDFRPTDWIDAKRVRRLDRYSQFAVVGTHMALADASLDLSLVDRERVAVKMGSALGGIAGAETEYPSFVRGGLKDVDPMLALMVFGGASSCNIAIEFDVSGPNSTNAMSCASGAIAIGEGWRRIRDGTADIAIVGGGEAPLAPLSYGAFSLIRSMSTRNDDPQHASRPFDKTRDGFVMAEGACMLILEEMEQAVARGARIYAEVAGFGTTNDAHHMTAPRPDGRHAARAMNEALKTAGMEAPEVDYVNAHGSSTPLNDAVELVTIHGVLGNRALEIPVSGTKGYTGHALGATGAMEAGIVALAIHRGWVPPTLNCMTPDTAEPFDLVLDHGRSHTVRAALSNSFGFGGINATLAFRSV